MTANGFRHVVMGPYPSENTTNIPEHAFLGSDPNTNWDERARGLGATMSLPVGSSAEENILCHTNDWFDELFLGKLKDYLNIISMKLTQLQVP